MAVTTERVAKRALTLAYNSHTMSAVKDISPRLRDAIEARRAALGIGKSELAERAGVTVQGLAPLRRGEVRAYQDRLKFAVCRVLGWSNDSIDRLMRDEPAVVVAGEVVSQPGATAGDPTVALRQEVTELALRLDHLQGLVEAVLSAADASRAGQAAAPGRRAARGKP